MREECLFCPHSHTSLSHHSKSCQGFIRHGAFAFAFAFALDGYQGQHGQAVGGWHVPEVGVIRKRVQRWDVERVSRKPGSWSMQR